MIGFDDIIGHEATLTMLRRMLERDRLPHALLLQGPEAVGKETTARALAALLLCEGHGEQACGVCEDCRLFQGGNHPDFLLLTRLPKKGSARRGDDDLRSVITVDQVRELSQLATLAPRRAPRRVFLVTPADRMNLEAQNALLKTLEEPPGRSVMALVAERPHLLLPTVRSRCFALRFGVLRPLDLAARLEERSFGGDEALVRAALAEGRPGRALDLDVESCRRRRDEAIRVLDRLTASPPALAELPAMAVDLAGKSEDSLNQGLELLQALLRDAARAGMSADDPGVVHADVSPALGEIGRRIGIRRAAELVASVDRLRSQARLNLNRTLVAEGLLAAVAGGPLPD